MAQSKSDLKNIGAEGEGFAMLDEYQHTYRKPESHVYPGSFPVSVAAQEKKEGFTVDPYQAARMAKRNSVLQKIGAEEFAKMDEYYSQKPKSHVYQGSFPVSGAATTVHSYQAARMYGGSLIADCRKTKKPLTRMRLPE